MNPTEKPLIAKTRIFILIVFIFGGAGFSWLGCYLLNIALDTEHLQFVPLILALVLLGFGIYAVFSVLKLRNYVLSSEKLTIKGIFGNVTQVLYLHEISGYTEIKKETKNGKWKELTLYSNRNKHTITSSTITEYAGLKRKLIRGKTRDVYLEKLWAYKNTRRFGIGALVFGGLIAIVFVGLNNQPQTFYDFGDFQKLKVTLGDSLKVEKHRSREWMDLNIEEYSNFHFSISNSAFDVMHASDVMDEIKIGDEFDISILKEDFEKKIAKTKELTFWEKSINYSEISVFGIQKDHRNYLNYVNINRFNKAKTSDVWGTWIGIGMALAFVLYGVFGITRKKPTRI